MANKTQWQNRIVNTGTRPAIEFVANPNNWRTHPKAQRDALTGVLAEVGWVTGVIVNKTTGHLLDGHARVEEALKLGSNTPVPFVEVELSAEDESTILATLDPISAMAAADKVKLDELLREVQTSDAAVQAMLSDVAQKAGLDFGKAEPVDSEPQVDRAEELRVKWGAESGQLWQLGEHRLLCGDCTKAEDVARVMQGDKAEMVWTDPPYGVAVGDKNKFLNSIARSNRVEANLENDTLNEAGLIAMLAAAFDNAVASCTAGAAWYVAAPAGPLHVLFGQALKDRGIWRQTIQWVKDNSTFSPMGVCHHWQAEPIFFGWLPNGAHRWYGGRKQTTVWNIDRPSKSPEHPTMKPVELVARAVENSSRTGEIVYEPFSGSGTTIIACENLNRKCRAIEIAPGYVAVALERWHQATGKTPVLLDSLAP